MSSSEIGLVSSIFTVGGLLGALLCGPFAAKYGRLQTIRFTTAFFIVGPVLEACASNVFIFALGRLVSGIGAGASVVVVPIYISETAPPKKKGFFGSFTQVMINLGILIAQLLGLFLSRGQLWRVILGVGGLIGLIQLLGLMFAVESPKWTAEKGEVNQAKKQLQWIRGQSYDIKEEVDDWHLGSTERRHEEQEGLLENDHQTARQSDSSSHGSLSASKQKTVSMFRVIVDPQYSQAVIAVVFIMVAQQLCGINSIVMYGVSILSDLLTTSSAILNVFVALLNLVVTVSCAPLIDRLGRKPCLMFSIAGMGIASLVLAIAILRNMSVLSAVTVLTFVGSFGIGLGPIPFLLSSELVGPEAVGAIQSLALAANWIATFVVAQFFPVVNKTLGKGKVYFVFAGVAAVSVAFVAWMVPETKGKRDADEVWGRDSYRGRRDE